MVLKSPFSPSAETDDLYLQCFLWYSVEALATLSGSGSQQFSDRKAVHVFIAHNSAVEARKNGCFLASFPLFHLTEVTFFPCPAVDGH